jgi:hypothetical protein
MTAEGQRERKELKINNQEGTMNTIIKTAVIITALTGLVLAQPPGGRGMGRMPCDKMGDMAPCNKSMRGKGGGFLNPRIIQELDLSGAQKKELKEYRHKMKKEKIKLRSEIAQLEEDIRYQFSQYPLKKAEIEKMKSRLVTLKGKITTMKIDGMLFFLSKLTKEQHQKFVDLHEQYGFGGMPGGFGGPVKGTGGKGKKK